MTKEIAQNTIFPARMSQESKRALSKIVQEFKKIIKD